MIAVVVPTIRPDSYSKFLQMWEKDFKKYNIILVKVTDGEDPDVNGKTVQEVMGDYSDLIYNKNDGVRNLGFAYIHKFLPRVQYILTLDDDVYPEGDTIGNHLKALQMKVPVSWISTASEYMRGFPYAVREEAEVVLSHGVWSGIKDYDAPTQLTQGNRPVNFYVGPIPKGIMYPMCIMNVAFKRKVLPFMYQAPMGIKIGLDRFADIWCGINSKRAIDNNGWAAVTGFSIAHHDRASNVFVNLVKEAKGIGLNETYWKGDESDMYFKLYEENRKRWEEFVST